MKFLSKVKSFDKKAYEVTLELLFLDEDIVTYLEELETSGKAFLSNVKSYHRKETTSDAQRKKWFVCVSKILDHNKITLTAEEIKGLHYELKISYFPCKFVKIGNKDIPIPPSINDLTQEEMGECLQRLILDYSQLGVNFEE